MNSNLQQIHNHALSELENNFAQFQIRLEQESSTPVGKFMELALEWWLDDYKRGLLRRMFGDTIGNTHSEFISELDCFVWRYLRGNQKFAIRWYAPVYVKMDYRLEDGRTISLPFPEDDEAGNQKMVETTKDDPKGSPVVVNEDNGSPRDPLLLVEAMQLFLARMEKQNADHKSLMERLAREQGK